MRKPKQIPSQTEQLARDAIGVCHKVQGTLGVDCFEKEYQGALALEFQKQGWEFRPQAEVLVTYEGQTLTKRLADFELGGVGAQGLFLEIKAKDKISARDERQARLYANHGNHPLCILANFGERPLWEKTYVGRQPLTSPTPPGTQVFYATHKADAWEANPPKRWSQRGFHRRVSSMHRPNPGDILLLYRFPASEEWAGICEIYQMKEIKQAYTTRWVDRFCEAEEARPPAFAYFVVDMTLAARLTNAVSYSWMGGKKAIREWNRWKARFRGISNSCGLVPPPVWEALRGLIISANPEVEEQLRQLGV